MYRTILVAVDGSALAEQAVFPAAFLARRAGAGLEIVRVHRPPSRPATAAAVRTAADEARRREEQGYLRGLARRVRRESGLSPRVRTVAGEVADALDHEVARSGADLLVMATYVRTGLARLRLGIAEDLVRSVRVPMLLVRSTEGARPAPAPFRHILLPLDGSPFAERILASATELGSITGARYTLLFVEAMAAEQAASDVPILPSAADAARRHAAAYLRGVVARLVGAGFPATSAATMHDRTAEAIVAFAREHAVDAIAMATHGRGSAARLLFGSVADDVVEAASVPVLLRRFEEHRPDDIA